MSWWMPSNTLIIGDANTMYGYAQGRTSATDSYIAALASAAAGLIPPTITPTFPTAPSAPALSVDTPPTLPSIRCSNSTSSPRA